MASLQVTPRGQRNAKDHSPGSQRSGGHVGSTLSHDDSTLQIHDEAAPSGSLTARHSGATAARRKASPGASPQLGKADFQRLQKKKEHSVKHEKMLAVRERDEANIRERALRSQQTREQKFREMMDEVQWNDGVRVEAARTIQQFEMEQERKRHSMWSEWDREVSQRIEHQLSKYMTRKPDGEGAYREELLPGDDPVKRGLVDQKGEESFRRIAESIIKGCPELGGQAGLKERINLRKTVENAVANRSTTRPVLPVEQWGQQELFAGPYGYFAQRCERMDRGEPFHSTRRMGADVHVPAEHDGVPAAGKKKVKTRIQTNYNHMGMLVGDHCKVGEAYRHKQSHGGGSAAPLQDHYFYEKGNTIVENEFPVGKRCFPHLVIQ